MTRSCPPRALPKLVLSQWIPPTTYPNPPPRPGEKISGQVSSWVREESLQEGAPFLTRLEKSTPRTWMDFLSHLHRKEKKKKMAGGRSWLPALKGHLPSSVPLCTQRFRKIRSGCRLWVTSPPEVPLLPQLQDHGNLETWSQHRPRHVCTREFQGPPWSCLSDDIILRHAHH